jgi:nicotinate-nucleotide adenylyltransferase
MTILKSQTTETAIGIFGGTFNPIHMGHLINAQVIMETCSLDKILFIPSKVPVHKELAGGISAENRAAMVERAIEKNPRFVLDRTELDRESPSYMIYTLGELEKKYPHSFFNLIIGADSFNELDTWKDYREILKRVKLIVMQRRSDPELRQDLPCNPENLCIAENPVIEISSTEIRNRIKTGRDISYFVPDSVVQYIQAKELYRT